MISFSAFLSPFNHRTGSRRTEQARRINPLYSRRHCIRQPVASLDPGQKCLVEIPDHGGADRLQSLKHAADHLRHEAAMASAPFHGLLAWAVMPVTVWDQTRHLGGSHLNLSICKPSHPNPVLLRQTSWNGWLLHSPHKIPSSMVQIYKMTRWECSFRSPT